METTEFEPFELTENDKGQLVLKRPGKDDLVDVRLRVAFPWSNPAEYVSIRSSEGKEAILLPSLDCLPEAQSRLIQTWLATSSFVPKVTAVHEVDTSFGYQQWKVSTDRGEIEFRVQEREDLRFLPDGRFTVKDADGNLYELPTFAQMDAGTRKSLEMLI